MGIVVALILAPRYIAVRHADREHGPSRRPELAKARPPVPEVPESGVPEWEPPVAADRMPAEAGDAEAPGAATPPTLDCVIEPFEIVEIGSPVTGVIDEVPVERGELVEKGQMVAQLESSVERAAVEVAQARARMDGELKSRQARLALGESKQKRASKLFESQALSLDLREEIETEAALARHELRQARENRRLASLELQQAVAALERRTIRTPISGVVVERLMAPGEVVDDETILKVAQIDPLRVEVILPSALFGSVRPGTRAAIEPEFPGDEVHVAEIKIVDRVIDAASGTFGVRLELPNPDHAIPGGLHCQVRFLDE